MRFRSWSTCVFFTALLALSACSPSQQAECTASTCAGCCDSSGQCQAGGFPQACGSNGLACVSCPSGATCQFGLCITGSGGGAGGGTGGGAGGGAGGGGGGMCRPKTCVELGKNCGEVNDTCGGTLNCGMCEVMGETCGGGGVANTCGAGVCMPKTCATLAKNCGLVSDGCGAQLNCGTCTGTETCGGAGVANVCGTPACTPKTCTQLGKNCGVVSDGCTGQLDCGTCTVSGETCGGGGVANVCGRGACTPKTCAQLGKDCGAVDDGCGNPLNCGTCSGFATCGGGGTPNVCGASCTGTCPTGYTCQGGVCAGGNPQSVVFDIPVPPQHQISGRITRNGVAPTISYCYSTSSFLVLRFTHATDARFNTTTSVRCDGMNGTNWSFSTLLYPGTYRVVVDPPNTSNATTNLPTWSTTIAQNLVVSAPMSNVVFDVPVPPQHQVSGRVTRNGVAPTISYCYSTSSFLVLRFTHDTDARFNTTTSVRCDGMNGTNWSFSTLLYPGTYRVVVDPPNTSNATTNLPTWSTTIAQNLVVSAPMSNVVFDVPVPPQHQVSGSITRNGVAPTISYCYSTSSFLVLRFTHDSDSRFNNTTSVRCDGMNGTNWSFSTLLYPGTYRVVVDPPNTSNATTNLPTWSTTIAQNLVVSAPMSNVVFDVPVPPQHQISGRVTRNGIAPTISYCYSTSSFLVLRFTHATDSRFNTTTSVRCDGMNGTTWSFSTLLYPGTYSVVVDPPNTSNATTNLPTWSTAIAQSLVVSAPMSNVVFDVPVPPQHQISGRVTRNGVAPTISYCYSTSSFLVLRFTHDSDSRFNTTTSVRCDGMNGTNWSFSTLLYPGTYRVVVDPPNTSNATTNLPTWSTTIAQNLVVSAPMSNVVFDVPVPTQYQVTGRITRNGVAPTISYCYSTSSFLVLRFTHLTDSRFNTTASVRCNGMNGTDWTFSTLLYGGVYRVVIDPPNTSNATTDLPSWSTTVVERLQVP